MTAFILVKRAAASGFQESVASTLKTRVEDQINWPGGCKV
jgi:hypothetical protein